MNITDSEIMALAALRERDPAAFQALVAKASRESVSEFGLKIEKDGPWQYWVEPAQFRVGQGAQVWCGASFRPMEVVSMAEDGLICKADTDLNVYVRIAHVETNILPGELGDDHGSDDA